MDKLLLLRPVKMALISLTIAYCALKSSSSPSNNKEFLHPIILIPGSGGNQLEARLTSAYKPSSLWCNRWTKKADGGGWFRLWFDPTVILKPYTKCFNERMMIYYDPSEDDYHNAPGVETRVPHFGSVEGLLYLNPSLKHLTSYMQPLVNSLEKLGYENGVNLFGAPYDFRYALGPPGRPDKVGSTYLSSLKTLIEKAFESNGNKPAIILSHSLGGLMAHQFLHQYSSPTWLEKYVRHFIAMSAPWGGAVETMRTFASGNAFGVPLVDPLIVRPEQRSATSNLWLLPSPRVFEGSSKKKPLVITRERAYFSSNITEFLEDVGFAEGVEPYKNRILPLVEGLPRPCVRVTCIYGGGLRTSEGFVYGKRKGFDGRPEVLYGDGDGTVNMASLMGLESMWGGRENVSIKVVRLPGISHTSILKDEGALKRVSEVSLVNSEISLVFGR